MDVVGFLNSYSYRFWEWAVEFLVVLFLVGGIAVLATGLGLIFNGAGALRFFAGMNRWVSTRRAFKPLEIPRDTRQVVMKYRMWLAAIFVAGGAFAVYVLGAHFNAAATVSVLHLEIFRPSFAAWLVESVRWVLIVGNLAAIAVGVMLAFFPSAIATLEAGGGRWFSERQVAKGRETIHLTLDHWVEAFPRASGYIIIVFALLLIGAYGLMLPALRW